MFYISWFLVGIFAVIIVIIYQWYNGIDFTLEHLINSLFLSLLGPITLFIFLYYMYENLYPRNKIIFKGRKKDVDTK